MLRNLLIKVRLISKLTLDLQTKKEKNNNQILPFNNNNFKYHNRRSS